MKLALPLHVVSLRLLAPESPPLHRVFPRSPTTCAPEPGRRVPGPQPQLSAGCRGAQARPRRHWACSEAAAGAGLLRRRSHSAAGGRAAAAGAPAPGVGVAGVSPPPLPLRARQPEPARKPRGAASQHPIRPSLVRSPKPRAGQPPGRSLAGWDACRALALSGHEPG